MFWGLIMEPQRRYTQVVSKAFHISMAALDISTSNDEPAQVMCGFEGRNYLLCTLKKPNIIQCPLDLDFAEGTEVSFASNGKCHVHLTGYLSNAFSDELLDDEEDTDEDDAVVDVSEMDSEEKEEEEEEETVFTKGGKRAMKVNGPPAKKSKADTPQKVSTTKPQSDDDDDDEDDSDFDIIPEMLEEEDVSEDDSDEQQAESDEENDVEEEESSLSDEEDYVSPKINGDIKRAKESPLTKKQQKKLNQQTPQKSPVEKQKNKEQGKTPNKDQSKTPNKDQSKTPNKEQKSPGKEKGKKEQVNEQKTPGKEQGKTPKKKTLQGGVIVEDLKEGNGDLVKPGKMVHVYYQGKFRDNNKVFDQVNKGPGFSFRVGKGEVIKGWDVALAGMKVGGKRKIVCPPGMAYGQKGSPPAIPPNSTLVFEVELKRVN